jgi:YTH domain-containing protein 1
VLTGFYDEGYRQKTLARHRRLKAIEEERQQLLREEQQDLERHRVGLDPFSMVPDAPEPTPALEVSVKQDHSSDSPPPAQAVPAVPSNNNRKRSIEETKDEQSEQSTTPAKISRRRSLERFSIEPLRQTPTRGPVKQSEERTPKQQDSTDISHRFARPDLFDNYAAPRRTQDVPDTRYFHIRSWNYDNVRAAQEDCTWVTQKANERTFTDAFEQSRRVILFFSVNNSKAFQGIAQMASIPGQ